MERSLLDTDILSKILKGRNKHVRQRQEAYLDVFGKFTISVITVMEMVEGFHRRGNADRIVELLSMLGTESHEILPLDYEASQIAGRIFADLARSGQPTGCADPMIAAIAIRHSLVLVTGNTEHFARVQRLGYSIRLNDWKSTKS